MSHPHVTVTYSSTFASMHLSRTHDCVMGHITTSHATHTKWVMSHTQVTVTYSSTFASIPQSRASSVSPITCVRRRLSLKGHIRMSHVTHVSRLYEWVMSHTQHTATHCNTLQHTATHCIWMIHVTHWEDYPWLATHEWVMSYIFGWVVLLHTSCAIYGVATIIRLLKIIGLFCRI